MNNRIMCAYACNLQYVFSVSKIIPAHHHLMSSHIISVMNGFYFSLFTGCGASRWNIYNEKKKRVRAPNGKPPMIFSCPSSPTTYPYYPHRPIYCIFI